MAITEAIFRRAGALLALVCALALTAPVAAGQKPDPRKDYALIYGTVWSADKRPVYGVTIKIRRANEKKARWELMSNHNGEFAQRVPPGNQDYVVWADVNVLKGKEKPSRTVHVENDERIDISLHLTE